MPSTPAIRVRNVGKTYVLGQERQQSADFREQLGQFLLTPLKRLRTLQGKVSAQERFQALQNINFDIAAGEVVGIIGRNGAGKSTLLKILSRIVAPTTGQVTLQGRVSSLLEVGTGFHQELTGRENIFLNGAIMGMSRRDIQRQFDTIVDFAGVEKFLDTPVKRYSSGMYVRLAFAVAAHLHSDILIVDEVLAVGDAEFQKRCLNKMSDASQSGRTVLFVSHNIQAITRLCTRALLLENGCLVGDDETHKIAHQYLHAGTQNNTERHWTAQQAPGNDTVRLRRIRLCDIDGNTLELVDIRQPIVLEMDYELPHPNNNVIPNLWFVNEDNVVAFITINNDLRPEHMKSAGHYRSRVHVPGNFLAEGTFNIHAAITSLSGVPVVHVNERDVITFQVVDKGIGDSNRGQFSGHLPGVVRPKLPWYTEQIEG